MDWIHNWINNALGHLPFFILGINGKPKINTTRIIESIIYAVVGGLLSSYVTLRVLEYKMSEIEKKVDRIYNDIYKPYIPSHPDRRP